MALFKRFKSFMAPFYWEFQDPDTGHLHKGANKKELLERIVNYRKQNGLEEIEMLETVVMNYLCSRRDHRAMCEPIPKLERGFWGYLKGGVALLKAVALGKMVLQEEAEGRALLCVGCPFNQPYEKTSVQRATDKLMEAAVEGRRRPVAVHNQLGNCGVCSCCLKFKVFAKGPFDLSDAEKVQMKSVGCWQVSDGEGK